jgi:polyphenol oxidase
MTFTATTIFLGKPHSYGGLNHPPEDTRHGRASVCHHLGIDAHKLLIPDQVHGTRVVVWDTPEAVPDVTGTDGLIVTHTDGVIGVLTADCVPILIRSRTGATVAAALHAGWRGVAGQILAAGVAQLSQLGHPPASLAVTLGPAALGCCYEVDAPVIEALRGSLQGDVPEADWMQCLPEPGKALVDLHRVLRYQAHALGISDVSVEPVCTLCTRPEAWWSHRRGETGRNLSVTRLMKGV